MATILDKDLTRESTVKYDDREIQVTLTAGQDISFKLKGMKSGVLTISIEDLYKQLAGVDAESVVQVAKLKPVTISNKSKSGEYDGGPMVPLNRLRTVMLTKKMELSSKLELESLLCEVLKQEVTL